MSNLFEFKNKFLLKSFFFFLGCLVITSIFIFGFSKYDSPINAANVLTNPSFTGGTTGWTLTNMSYDSTNYQDSAGSLYASAGRKASTSATAVHTSYTSIGSTDTVTLSGYWSHTTTGNGSSTLYIEIEEESSAGTWTGLWTSGSQSATNSWTLIDNIDVSSYFSTGSYRLRLRGELAGGAGPGSLEETWFDNLNLDVVSPQPIITVGTTGTQTSSVEASTSDFYIGGAFTFVRDSDSTSVTSITVSETGTISDANISGLILYYKQEATCSTSIPGDATQFNSTAGTFTSGSSTVTGTMTVGTSQVCVYAEVDIGSASNGDTVEIQITNPSTQVTASAGNVSPATAVAISGTTTIEVNVAPSFTNFSNDGPKNPGGDMTFSAVTEILYMLGHDGFPKSLTFKPDGTTMYIVGTSSDTVYQFTLNTAWDVSTASYANKSFYFGNQDTVPQYVTFKPDGTAMYIVGGGEDTVYQFTLHTAWDVSSASYANKSFYVGTQETTPSSVTFKSDGTAMYIVGTNSDRVYQYTLNTAWDVSTASYANKSFYIGTQEIYPSSVTFKSDGTAMYIVGTNIDTVYQYTLNTAWDVSTASYANKSFYVGTQETIPYSVTFKSDGTAMYIVGTNSDRAYQYTLNTAWDVSTTSYANKSFLVGPLEQSPKSATFKSDGTTMYIVGTSSDTVYQYTLSTAWDILTASYSNKSFYIGNQDTESSAVTFKSDGTTMYIVGTSSDTVYQFTLNTAWDVSSASYANKSFYFGNQDTVPLSLTFKSDGTAMYIAGYLGNLVLQYTLNTAWDVSSASYANKSFSLSSQLTYPQYVTFKPDGTAMYVLKGGSEGTVYQYTLNTAWDVSTASYADKSFYIGTQEAYPTTVTFKSDGTSMYIVGQSYTIYQYTLSTGWDVSTASYGTDPNGDSIMLLVCKTQGITGTACDGGASDTLCTSSLVTSNPSCTHSVPIPTPDGSHDAYPYVFDSNDLGSTNTAQGALSTYIVNNVAPVVSAVTINGGSAIDLTAGSTKSVNITGTITDNNSCEDVSSVLGYAYRSGVGYVGGQAISTYYFDASDSGPSDPDGVWTNDTYAFDGYDNTVSYTTYTSPGSTTTNYLSGGGTNVPTGRTENITNVYLKYYYYYTDDQGYIFSLDNITLPPPVGGWTWLELSSLSILTYWYDTGGSSNLVSKFYYSDDSIMYTLDYDLSSQFYDIGLATANLLVEYETSTEGCSMTANANYNNCYPDITCTVNTGTCTGSTDASATYTCTANLLYYADPTDTNTQYPTETWMSTIKATDNNSLSDYTGVATGVELNSLMAFNITTEVNYGALGIGESNDPLDRTTLITPTGNIGLDHEVSGPANMCTDFPTCSGSTIAIGYQKYALSLSTSYSSATALSTTATEVSTNVAKPITTTPTGKSIWWGMLVPTGTNNGSYDGTITITGLKSAIENW